MTRGELRAAEIAVAKAGRRRRRHLRFVLPDVLRWLGRAEADSAREPGGPAQVLSVVKLSAILGVSRSYIERAVDSGMPHFDLALRDRRPGGAGAANGMTP